jgi:hypothetical protein
MTGILFKIFGPAIHRHIAAGYLRPPGFTGMEPSFSGLDGRAYYTWADVGDMPPVRQKHIERCLCFANAGIGEKTLEELCAKAEAANMDALRAEKTEARSQAHSRLAFIIGELKNRPKEVIPEEVYYDIAACFAIREDEDPRAFDPVIHAQKIDMLRKAGQQGHDFFAKLSGFKKLLGHSLTTEEGFIALLSSWTAQRTRSKAIHMAYAQS